VWGGAALADGAPEGAGTAADWETVAVADLAVEAEVADLAAAEAQVDSAEEAGLAKAVDLEVKGEPSG
jgi:hypothetical protein